MNARGAGATDWPGTAPEAERLRRLRAIVAHARDRVPFYGRTLEAIDPESIRSFADLAALPTVAKRDLRAAPLGERVARGCDPRRLLSMRSSGSTGEPFEVRRSLREEILVARRAQQVWRALGWRPGDRWARLVGGFGYAASWRARLLAALRRALHRQISCKQPPERIVAELRRLRPTVLTGYPGVLTALAPHVAADTSGAVRPRLVVPGGEVLTAEMRAAIRRGFAAEVREIYGCYELGLLGWECAESGLLHLDGGLAEVEVVVDGRPAGEGEEGDVFGTALHSFAMPFVRYRVGDRAVRGPSPCPCGFPGATLAAVRGRIIDYYRLPDGSLLHHYALFAPAADRARVRERIVRYQVVQEAPTRFRARVAFDAGVEAAEVDRLRAELARELGAGFEVVVEAVGELDFEPSGKFRLARCDLPLAPGETT